MKLRYSLAILVLFLLSSCYGIEDGVVGGKLPNFDGERAYKIVVDQVSLGPRYPGSEGHEAVQVYIIDYLKQFGWSVEQQKIEYQGKQISNIIAYRHEYIDLNQEWVIFGAHYDTRMVSDEDPNPSRRMEPVPGANDGGSGVAVLLEMARILPSIPNMNIWLVFFDAEDNGKLNGWQWAMGSAAFVDQLTLFPDKVVIVDMVGDADQNIYLEKSSDPELAAEVWQAAEDLGIETFINEPKHRILDDHTAFLMKEIPAIDIIDIEYPYWHTTQDTIDKVSPQSLKNVGDVLLFWLLREHFKVGGDQ